RSGSMTLKELTDLCTTLSQKVLYLENVKTAQAKGRKILKSQKKFQDIDDLVDKKVIVKYNGSGEKRGSIAETVNTARPNISTVRLEVSTVEPKTLPTTTTLFDDKDVTITDTLVDALVPIGFEEDEKIVRSRKKIAAGSSSKQKSPKKKKVNDQEFVDSDKELRKWLKVVLDDDKGINYKTLDVKIFDRQDVFDLHKIVMERFLANDPEGYDLILWGDLKTLMESSKDDEIWKTTKIGSY
nr:hypothetical protein [Tanacetum cinerariifolium]